jgi:hypothetical protein
MHKWNKALRLKKSNQIWGRRGQLAVSSKDEAGDRNHIWAAPIHYMRPRDKLTGWRSQNKWLGFPLDWGKSIRTLWRGQRLQIDRRDCTQRKSHRCRSIDHSRIFFLHEAEKKDDGDTPGPTGTLWGSLLGWAALRRERWEQLESNSVRTEPRGRKARPIMGITSTALGKGEMIALRRGQCSV